jgi:hypothetical protein
VEIADGTASKSCSEGGLAEADWRAVFAAGRAPYDGAGASRAFE